MENADYGNNEPPQAILDLFDMVMSDLEATDRLEEKKSLEKRIVKTQEHKTVTLYWNYDVENYGIVVTGIKTAFNTYEIIKYDFIYEGPSGSISKTLDFDQSRKARLALQQILLYYNYDINVRPFIFKNTITE